MCSGYDKSFFRTWKKSVSDNRAAVAQKASFLLRPLKLPINKGFEAIMLAELMRIQSNLRKTYEVKKKLLLLLCVSMFVPLLHAAEEFPSSTETAFAALSKLKRLTPQPVWVDAAVAMMCAAPRPEYIAARKKEFGPHHNVPVNLYANDAAEKIVSANGKAYPIGSLILKEKLAAKGEATAIGGMRKREKGFDPANGDWEYFFAEKSKPFVIGVLPDCVACHAKTKETDYVYARKGIMRFK
jgi:hypothetical protein